MTKALAIFFFLCSEIFPQQVLELKPLISSGSDLSETIGKKLKNGDSSSYKEAVPLLLELERRTGKSNDWMNQKLFQALGKCYFEIGNFRASYQYWEKFLLSDTTYVTEKRPKFIISQSEAEYNRLLALQNAVFSDMNPPRELLISFTSLVDSLYLKEKSSPDTPIFMFNKCLILVDMGNTDAALACTKLLKLSFANFRYMSKVDSLIRIVARK